MKLTFDDVKELQSVYDQVYGDKSTDDVQRKLRHEVKNKLTNLTGVFEHLGGIIPGEEDRYAQIYLDAKKILRRIKDGASESVFNIADVVDDTIKGYSSQKDIKKLPIEKLYSSDSIFVKGNDIDVKGSVYNFLTNVSRHSDSQVIDVHVDTYDENYAAVSVIDYGSKPALDIHDSHKKSLEFIFKKGTSGKDGFGDAMYLFKKDLNAFGGDILVDYAFKTDVNGLHGYGTKFTALLPLANTYQN